jgi:hypothetical protein
MSADPTIQVTFVSDSAFADRMAADVPRLAGALTIVTREPVRDPTALGFDVGAVVAVVTLAKALFFTDAIVPALFGWIRATKPRRIRITSPLGIVTLEPRDDMTEAEIRQALRKLVEV